MSSKVKRVTFRPERVKVDGGTIHATTEISIPETQKRNSMNYEISVFQCECGCPECISIVQQTFFDKEIPELVEEVLFTITPEDYNDFISALKKSYEAIISKNN